MNVNGGLPVVAAVGLKKEKMEVEPSNLAGYGGVREVRGLFEGFEGFEGFEAFEVDRHGRRKRN